MKKNAGFAPFYVALFALLVVAAVGGGLLLKDRSTSTDETAAPQQRTAGTEDTETKTLDPSEEAAEEMTESDTIAAPEAPAASGAEDLRAEDAPASAAEQSEKTSPSTTEPSGNETPVITAPKMEAVPQAIAIGAPAADWETVAFSELGALISLAPGVSEIMHNSISYGPSVSIENADGTSYTLIRSEEPYEELSRQLTELGVGAVTFKGKSVDTIAGCKTFEGTSGSWETCVALGKISDKETLVATCMSTAGTCARENTFFRVVGSFETKKPPFIGFAGAELSDVAWLNENLPEELRLALPDDTSAGYLVINRDIVTLLDSEAILPDAYASGIYAGSPADKAGLKAGDVILTVNGRDASDFSAVMLYHNIGDTVTITYLHDNVERTTQATLTAWPEGAAL